LIFFLSVPEIPAHSLIHLTLNASLLNASYFDTLKAASLIPLATALPSPDSVDVQYIEPALSPPVKDQRLFWYRKPYW